MTRSLAMKGPPGGSIRQPNNSTTQQRYHNGTVGHSNGTGDTSYGVNKTLDTNSGAVVNTVQDVTARMNRVRASLHLRLVLMINRTFDK